MRWVKDLQQSLEKLGSMEIIECGGIGWTDHKLKQLLKDAAWRRVKAVWREKTKGSLKLEMTGHGKLMDNECKARCVGKDCKRRRRMMAKLRGARYRMQNWE